MTAKQIKLARLLANDDYPVSKSAACRAVYDFQGDPHAATVHRQSITLCGNRKVVALVEAIRAENRRQNSAILHDREAMRMEILRSLLQLAKAAEAAGKYREAIAALRVAGQTNKVGLFAKCKDDEIEQPSRDVAGELLVKLRQLVQY